MGSTRNSGTPGSIIKCSSSAKPKVRPVEAVETQSYATKPKVWCIITTAVIVLEYRNNCAV